MADVSLNETQHASLVEVLDRVLNKGVVVSGKVQISVAGIHLIDLDLNLLLVSTAKKMEVLRRVKGDDGLPIKKTGLRQTV